MIVKLSSFDDGIHNIQVTSAVNAIGLEEPFFGNVEVKIKIDKSYSQVLLYCDARLTTKLSCDRCNKDFKKIIDNRFQLICMYGSSEGDENNEIIYLKPDEDKVDISKEVADYSRISLPMKNLCNDDCKGLCLKCGTDLNETNCNCSDGSYIDVWKPLQKLKGKLK